LDVDELVDSMKVIFLGKTRPEVNALRWVCEVDRHRVRAALSWLILHNKDYKDFKLNELPFDKLLENQVPESLYNSVTVASEDTFNTKGMGYNEDEDDDSITPTRVNTASSAVGPDDGHFNEESQKIVGLKKAVMYAPVPRLRTCQYIRKPLLVDTELFSTLSVRGWWTRRSRCSRCVW
jgi:hypothetical protein